LVVFRFRHLGVSSVIFGWVVLLAVSLLIVRLLPKAPAHAKA
jgi:hypothetical protein